MTADTGVNSVIRKLYHRTTEVLLPTLPQSVVLTLSAQVIVNDVLTNSIAESYAFGRIVSKVNPEVDPGEPALHRCFGKAAEFPS